MKKRFALMPSEREKECHHELGFRWSGAIPCTGIQRCLLCGIDMADVKEQPLSERRIGNEHQM